MKEIIIIFNKQSNYTIDLEKIQMKKRIICIFLSFNMLLNDDVKRNDLWEWEIL